MASKAHIRLNLKKLYGADGYAVKELLKIASTLYNATNVSDIAELETGELTIALSMNDVKRTRSLASEITLSGATLFDLLGQEKELMDARNKAISQPMDMESVEGAVNSALKQVNAEISNTEKMIGATTGDKINLEKKIEKKAAELARIQKRLSALKNFRPAYMDEYEKLQEELNNLYVAYLAKYRNLQYLEGELDAFNAAEQEKWEEAEQERKQLQVRYQEEERLQMLNEDGDERGGSAGGRPSRPSGPKGAVVGSMNAGDGFGDDSSTTETSSDGALSVEGLEEDSAESGSLLSEDESNEGLDDISNLDDDDGDSDSDNDF